MMHLLDFSLIYAHLSQNFVVAIYALFPQIFWDWKVESADFFTFRMYGWASNPWKYDFHQCGRKLLLLLRQWWPSWPQPDSVKGKFSYSRAPVPPGSWYWNPPMGAAEQCKISRTSLIQGLSLRPGIHDIKCKNASIQQNPINSQYSRVLDTRPE